MSERRIDPDVLWVRPAAAFLARWPTLAFFALLSAGMVLGVEAVWRRRASGSGWVYGVAGFFALLWAVLFLNNVPSLWLGDGFDAEGPFEEVYERVADLTRAAGATVVSAVPAFRSVDPATIRVAVNDVHPNARGHAIIARAIREAVDPAAFAREAE